MKPFFPFKSFEFCSLLLAEVAFVFPAESFAVSQSDFQVSVTGIAAIDCDMDIFDNNLNPIVDNLNTVPFVSPQTSLEVPYGKLLLVRMSYSLPDGYGAQLWASPPVQWFERMGSNLLGVYYGNGTAYSCFGPHFNRQDIPLDSLRIGIRCGTTWEVGTVSVNVVFRQADVTVSFDGCGGIVGDDYTLGYFGYYEEFPWQGFNFNEPQKLVKNGFIKYGCVFRGWATSRTRAAQGIVDYADETEITPDVDMTLYAVWYSPVLTLEVESADWTHGSISFRCLDEDVSNAKHTYSLFYDDGCGSIPVPVDGADGANVSVGADGVAHLTDIGFSSRLDGIAPVKYVAMDENGRWSAECVTRNRYGLFVGVNLHSMWNLGNADNAQFAYDANAFWNLAVSTGSFASDNVRVLTGANAGYDNVRGTLAGLRTKTRPGDVFVLFLSTHGSFGLFDGKPKLALHGVESYTASELQQDVRAFDSGVAVVGIIMACHAQAMIGNGEISTDAGASDKVASWLLDAGMASCPANVAWVTSCGYDENSLLFATSYGTSPFGTWFVEKGWGEGYADRLLYGTSWNGGNRDGRVTFLELAKYSEVFSHGYSDDLPSGVRYENEGLLSKVVAGATGSGIANHRPNAPTSCTAAKGSSDSGIEIAWDTPSDSTILTFWLFRSERGGSSARCVCRYARNGSFIDPKSIYMDWNGKQTVREPKMFNEYEYFVKAVNPCGISEASSPATGYRGRKEAEIWLDEHRKASMSSASYSDICEFQAENGITYEACYVAGLNPNNPASKLTTSITMDTNGKPVVSWAPDLNENGTKSERVYRILGAKSLGGEWDDVTDVSDPDAEGYRFFKATVELP